MTGSFRCPSFKIYSQGTGWPKAVIEDSCSMCYFVRLNLWPRDWEVSFLPKRRSRCTRKQLYPPTHQCTNFSTYIKEPSSRCDLIYILYPFWQPLDNGKDHMVLSYNSKPDRYSYWKNFRLPCWRSLLSNTQIFWLYYRCLKGRCQSSQTAILLSQFYFNSLQRFKTIVSFLVFLFYFCVFLVRCCLLCLKSVF